MKATKKDDRQYIKALMSSYPYNVDIEEVFESLKQLPEYDISRLRYIYDKYVSTDIGNSLNVDRAFYNKPEPHSHPI